MKLESQNDTLKTNVWDLRKIITRYAQEEEFNLARKDRRIKSQADTIDTLKAAHSVLEREGKHMHDVAAFWAEHINQ
jgi:hypothetical protein